MNNFLGWFSALASVSQVSSAVVPKVAVVGNCTVVRRSCFLPFHSDLSCFAEAPTLGSESTLLGPWVEKMEIREKPDLQLLNSTLQLLKKQCGHVLLSLPFSLFLVLVFFSELSLVELCLMCNECQHKMCSANARSLQIPLYQWK